jgi:glutathione S-transferase
MSFTIYGPSYSTYVRSVRLLLEEKGAPYELVEVDMFKGETKAPEHLSRHPFGMVPAFAHDGFELYESDAILRYADRVAPGPSFQPSDPKAAARMDQLMGITDAYAYPNMITRMVIQRVVVPMMGGSPDEAAIEAAKPRARICLSEFERLMGPGPYLVGERPTLADLLLAPIFGYFTGTPEGKELLGPHTDLQRWWQRLEGMPSMAKTAPKLG